MRSLLFVPADSTKKLEKALTSGTDIIIVDLEDSVALSQKQAARQTALAFMKANPARYYVRVNSLDTGLTDDDLADIMAAKPEGIMLPKSEHGQEITLLCAKLRVYEAQHSITDGKTHIIPVATETAKAIFTLGTYAGSSKRLKGITWGAEDLSADIGAETNRAPDGRHTEPFRLARSLTVFAAASAGVEAIDTVFPSFKDEAGFLLECEEAKRDGFSGKMAIHPAQVPIINAVFTPSPDLIAEAQAIVAAFTQNPHLGVISMIDRPHFRRAERLLSRIGHLPKG
jgi:citrate lyase subunit beta / citryl-CoA lyase